MLATEIKLSTEEEKILLFLVEVYKERTTEITEDGIFLLWDEIAQKTWLKYYQQMVLKKKLALKGLVTLKFRDIPRKVYFKLNTTLTREYFEARWFEWVVDSPIFK